MSDQQTTSARRRPGANPALRMALIRNIHSWVGLFIAPSVLFFAITGALQLFKFHEAHGDYHPAAVVEKLGRLHKDQEFALRPPRPAPKAAARTSGPDADDDHDHEHEVSDHDHADHDHADNDRRGHAEAPARNDAEPWNKTAIRWLFLGASAGLTLSTLLGIWMALQPHRRKPSSWILLAAGVLLPVVLSLV